MWKREAVKVLSWGGTMPGQQYDILRLNLQPRHQSQKQICEEKTLIRPSEEAIIGASAHRPNY